ncbi:Cationic peroxidase 2, partial [Cucurbita argyrosperma subsp. argyrosperma]
MAKVCFILVVITVVVVLGFAASTVHGQGTRLGFYRAKCPNAESITGGLRWEVPTGRRDGRISLVSEVNLPSFSDSIEVQKEKFRVVGLDTHDLVTLAGSHTIGTASCRFFSYRLYNFTTATKSGADPTINPSLVGRLRELCPEDGDGSNRVELDIGSPEKFDLSFYSNLRRGGGILESDQKLWNDDSTRPTVRHYLGSRILRGRSSFRVEFGKSMVKMSNIDVKTGIEVPSRGTHVGFYSTTCPQVEAIVRATVKSHFRLDPTVAPGLLRMHFHDCFVRGCDASVLLVGPRTERAALPNLSLNGFEVINDAKSRLERACPGIVSCADILALAARDSVVLTKGVSWGVPTGRRDGRVSLALEANNALPKVNDTIQTQRKLFKSKGLNIQDLVTLVDPAMNPSFVHQLRTLCPKNGEGSPNIGLDISTPNQFDTSFFSNLRNGRGVLESDQKLWNDPSTRAFVRRFLLKGSLGLNFDLEFGKSMVKMSNIGVKTGTRGEIRKICTMVN